MTRVKITTKIGGALEIRITPADLAEMDELELIAAIGDLFIDGQPVTRRNLGKPVRKGRYWAIPVGPERTAAERIERDEMNAIGGNA